MIIDLDKLDFEDIIEYIASAVGNDFIKIVTITQDILDNPHEYTGAQAAMNAVRLAAYRVKIGIAAQYMKIKAVHGEKDLYDRLTKDAMLSIYDSLEEMINCLKIVARQDHA